MNYVKMGAETLPIMIEGAFIKMEVLRTEIRITGHDKSTKNGLWLRHLTKTNIPFPYALKQRYGIKRGDLMSVSVENERSVTITGLHTEKDIDFPLVGFYPDIMRKPVLSRWDAIRRLTPRGTILEENFERKGKQVFVNLDKHAYIFVQPDEELFLPDLEELASWYGHSLASYPYSLIGYRTNGPIIIPSWFWSLYSKSKELCRYSSKRGNAYIQTFRDAISELNAKQRSAYYANDPVSLKELGLYEIRQAILGNNRLSEN